MKKSLNTLSLTLISNGHTEAANSINDLIKTLDNINDRCHVKAAESASDRMVSFMNSLKKKKDIDPANKNELEKWNKILEDYDKVPYRAEKFHEISDSILAKVMKPFMKKKKDLEATAPTITEEERAISTELLSSQLNSSATLSNIEALIKQSNMRIDNYLNKGGLKKTAIPDQYLNEYSKESYAAAEQFKDLISNDLALYSTAQNQGFWSKMLHGDEAKAAARLAGDTPGFWGKVLPGFGLLFSLPLALKNIHEAYINGKKIAEELPLEKYGINKTAALTGNPMLLNSLMSSIKNAIKENEDDPEKLYELLEIIKTISAYWLDLIFAITNVLMTIIDALTIVAVLIDGPLPIGDVVGGFFGFFISIGLMGIEFGSEHYVSKYWTKQTEKIKKLAEERVRDLGGEVKSDKAGDKPALSKTDTPASAPAIQTTDPSNTPEENLKLFMDSMKKRPATA